MGYHPRPINAHIKPRQAPGAPLSDSNRVSKDLPKRPAWLLLMGAVIGLALATAGLLEARDDARKLPPGAAALVGDRTIRVIDYQRVLAGVEGDLRGPIDDAMRRRVLDRMIDEELLVQRALDLGLAVIDRRVRGELTSNLIDSIVSEADSEEPSETAVARHFEENLEFFTRPGRLRAQTIFFSSRRDSDAGLQGAAIRVALAAERLADGARVAKIEAELADPQLSPIPDALLPASKIRDYAGPRILKVIEGLEVGSWSAPIESAGSFYLAQLLEREPATVPALENIEDLVRQDLKRRRGDQALRRYLDDLRDDIAVSVDDSIF